MRPDSKTDIMAELKRLEGLYGAYQDPRALMLLKGRTLDAVWGIFTESAITPEAAPFVVGRMFQALAEYKAVVFGLDQYQKLEAKLVQTQKKPTEPEGPIGLG